MMADITLKWLFKKTIGSFHWLHWFVIICSILLTIAAWQYSLHQTNKLNQAKFKREANQVVAMVQERMIKYVDALDAAAAHLSAANSKLTKTNWRKYTHQLGIRQKYPGINGVGVIYRVPSHDIDQFEQKQTLLGNPLKVYPKHNNPISLPITFIEPIEINKAAHGLDVAHEANRLNGAERAMRANKPIITGPITLVQDSKKTAGFLLYVPFYKNNKMAGYVYAPFIVNKLMGGLLSTDNRQVAIMIKDDNTVIYEDKIYAADQTLSQTQFRYARDLPMYGRIWHFEVLPQQSFIDSVSTELPRYILIAGIIVEIAIILLFVTISRSRNNAIKYAESVTGDLRKLASEDQLTGLANRSSFAEAVTEQIKKGNIDKTLVLYLDLDNFKNVNDVLGHVIGDSLLVVVAKWLNRFLEGNNFECYLLARLGGDEFALLIVDSAVEQRVEQICAELIKGMERGFKVGENTLKVTFSIGATQLKPYLRENLSEEDYYKMLLQYSDIAMYEAKATGKNQFVIFNNDLYSKTTRNLLIEKNMHDSIQNGEFKIAYQPIYLSGDDLKLVGFEALVRWTNPALGSVSPMEFIPLAERTGFIVPLGLHLFELVCQQLAFWKQNDHAHAERLMSINCSAVQLAEESFPDDIASMIAQHGIEPEQIIIEVTETVLMTSVKQQSAVLCKLSEMGLSIAIDDFGTGYSSLNYLHMLPVDYLKIDRSFVNRISDGGDEMLKNIIKLARTNNLKIIAEGIETPTQLDFLVQEQCDYLQGYLLSKPKQSNKL